MEIDLEDQFTMLSQNIQAKCNRNNLESFYNYRKCTSKEGKKSLEIDGFNFLKMIKKANQLSIFLFPNQ
jgi:hypothetical protein